MSLPVTTIMSKLVYRGLGAIQQARARRPLRRYRGCQHGRADRAAVPASENTSDRPKSVFEIARRACVTSSPD